MHATSVTHCKSSTVWGNPFAYRPAMTPPRKASPAPVASTVSSTLGGATGTTWQGGGREMTVNESVGAVVKCHFSWLSRDGVRNPYTIFKRGLQPCWSTFELGVLVFLKSEDTRAEVYVPTLPVSHWIKCMISTTHQVDSKRTVQHLTRVPIHRYSHSYMILVC